MQTLWLKTQKKILLVYLLKDLNSETVFNEVIYLARKGKEEIVAQTSLTLDQAETIVRFHGSKS